jgi:serine/threonine-protein kinase HipA
VNRAPAVDALDVYKGDTRVGILQRLTQAARFCYLPEATARDAVAHSLPVRAAPYEVFGEVLHGCFAGILPEGLRLGAWARVAGAATEDGFSLLAVAGSDPVGAVRFVPHGEPLRAHEPPWALAQLTSKTFAERASEAVSAATGALCVAGVQPKLSVALAQPLGLGILKLAPTSASKLAENEAFFTALAQRCGMRTARTRLLRDAEGRVALLTERFDRAPCAHGMLRIPQEDLCQVLARPPSQKCAVTLAEALAALAVCAAPQVARLQVLRQQAFSYVIGNGNLHAKNLSVQETSGLWHLTPAYDLMSTQPYGQTGLLLAMEQRTPGRLQTADFVAAGEQVGLRGAAVAQMLARLVRTLGKGVAQLESIGLGPARTAQLARFIAARLAELGD